MKNLLVILLEDNALDAELNEVELQQHLTEYLCTFHWVKNKKDFLTLLEEVSPDLVLSDYNIPSYTGLEALRDFKLKFPNTPFLFVTGTQQEEVAANAIKEGAWDYVVKDRLTRLTMAVQNALRLRKEQLKNIEIQEAVIKNELRFRTLFNSASDAIFILKDLIILDCNVAAEKIYGYPREELLAQNPITLSPSVQPSGQSTSEAAKEKFNLALEGSPQFFEWRHKKSDGTLFDCEVSLNRMELGGEIFIQGIVRDITDRKQTMVSLADREKRFRNLVEQSPLAVIEWDTQLNVLEWNEAAENIFGYTRDEAIGRSAFGLVLKPELNVHIKNLLHQLVNQEGGVRSTNENITKQGTTITCEWYNRPLTNEDGQTVGIVAMVEDITDKLKAEKALKESELKFRQIIQSSPMGIYVYEVNDKNQLVLIDTNAAADALTEINNTKLIGLTIEEAFPGLQGTDIPKHYLNAALNGTPWYSENIQYHDGKVNGAFEVYAFQAGSKRVAIMFLNVTERRQIEAAIKNKNEELTKINTELDRFVYSASHDLRAPIASLLGLVEVARLETDLKEVNKLLDMQKRSLVKLDSFIHDIVSYSRNNRLDLEIEAIDFNSLIEGIFEQLHFMDQLAQLKRKISIAPHLNFSTDRKRISVILTNLISNAIKYADEQKPNPFIEVRIEKDVNDGVVISVSDNGEGIGSDQLPKIFDMFYRATLRSTGSGIGLYIVHEIIQKLNGSIQVESEKGEGSNFVVRLPNLSAEIEKELDIPEAVNSQAHRHQPNTQ